MALGGGLILLLMIGALAVGVSMFCSRGADDNDG